MSLDRFVIQNSLSLITEPVGVSAYDFDFRQFFDCRTPYEFQNSVTGVARVGAFDDYETFYSNAAKEGINLVHSPEEHTRCTSLPIWYPLIEKLTPRSRWYSDIPDFDEIESEFGLPVFIKGSRQTSKHNAAASIVQNHQDFDEAVRIFRSDPILHWQDFVCRELVALRSISGGSDDKIPASFEFRTFWWKGALVGSGPYWLEANKYNWSEAEKSTALKIAKIAVDAINCAFLVVDLAQTTTGDWVVIECNDGMESGYAGASPYAIWQNIIDRENKT